MVSQVLVSTDVLVVVMIPELFHHLLVQTTIVSLAVMMHYLIGKVMVLYILIHYGMVKVVVVVKLLVVSVILFLGFISP